MFGAATVGGMARDDVHFVWLSKLNHRPIAATVHRSKTDGANAIGGWLSIKVWCQDHRLCQGSGYAMPGTVPGLPDKAHENMYNIIIPPVQIQIKPAGAVGLLQLVGLFIAPCFQLRKDGRRAPLPVIVVTRFPILQG